MEGTVEKKELVRLLVTNGMPNRYSVHCETNHDSVVLEHQIPEAGQLAYELLCGLGEIADTWRGDHRGSAEACSKKAEREMLDSIRSVIPYMSDDSLKILSEECAETLENRNAD